MFGTGTAPAKGKRKGNCPRCGARMKLAQRFCTSCGSGNPLLVRRVPARRPAVKSAGYAVTGKAAPYAPVHDMELARLWREAHSEDDPDRREQVLSVIMKRSGVA